MTGYVRFVSEQGIAVQEIQSAVNFRHDTGKLPLRLFLSAMYPWG